MKKYGFCIKGKNKEDEKIILNVILNGLQGTKPKNSYEQEFLDKLWYGVINEVYKRRGK